MSKPRPKMLCGYRKCPHPEHIAEDQGTHGSLTIVYHPLSESFHVFKDSHQVLRTRQYGRVAKLLKEN